MENTIIPLINGTAYSWGDVVCTIAGVPVNGITSIDYDDEQEIVNNYGAGRFPVSRAKGKVTASARITLTMEEVVALQAQAPNGRLQDIEPFDIGVSYLPDGGKIVTDKIRNCQFKKNSRSVKEGDTQIASEFELIVSHIEWANE